MFGVGLGQAITDWAAFGNDSRDFHSLAALEGAEGKTLPVAEGLHFQEEQAERNTVVTQVLNLEQRRREAGARHTGDSPRVFLPVVVASRQVRVVDLLLLRRADEGASLAGLLGEAVVDVRDNCEVCALWIAEAHVDPVVSYKKKIKKI